MDSWEESHDADRLYRDNKLIDCGLLALDIDNNIGAQYTFSYDGASKNKNKLVYCFYCNGRLKHICRPPHRHQSTVYAVGYNLLSLPQAEDPYPPRDGSPTIQMVHKPSKIKQFLQAAYIISDISRRPTLPPPILLKGLAIDVQWVIMPPNVKQRHTEAIDGHRLTGEAGLLPSFF